MDISWATRFVHSYFPVIFTTHSVFLIFKLEIVSNWYAVVSYSMINHNFWPFCITYSTRLNFKRKFFLGKKMVRSKVSLTFSRSFFGASIWFIIIFGHSERRLMFHVLVMVSSRSLHQTEIIFSQKNLTFFLHVKR